MTLSPKNNVLVVGGGGREHTLAWALAQSPQVNTVFVAPGNAGTDDPARGLQNVPIPATDIPALANFARQNAIALTVVGPEAPLVAGIADTFRRQNLPIFAPVAAAARLEGSKAFAKNFMRRHGIPTGDYRVFTDIGAAREYIRAQNGGIVVKADGLAAGKGVLVCDSPTEAEAGLEKIMAARAFGAAGDTVVIEERLSGAEISILAWCDGKTAVPLIPARDHKRAFDGDRGPNTGGMGAIAPAPDISPALVDEIRRTVLQPAVNGLAADGTPYVGILYAGLMITPAGAKVLEFNCRFGDPETQAVLPLLETDIFDVFRACISGTLMDIDIRWRAGACATVVMASPGYPERYPKGLPISGADGDFGGGVTVFHAGTARADDGSLVTAGGRVLAVSAVATDVPAALDAAYRGVRKIHFDGAHFRTDIGRTATAPSAYAVAGVDLEAGKSATFLMKKAVQSTYTPAVLAGLGAFGGLFSADALAAMAHPVLVASTDGVGTKAKVAARLNRWDTIGQDLVNHCVNDILVQGARPLFFLDYVASAKLDPVQIAAIVTGMAQSCKNVDCALLGGETAEMPGVYLPGEVDVAGTIVGAVERAAVLDGSAIRAGDVLLALPSSGLHTNGFSLARHALDGLDWDAPHPALGGQTIGDELLAVHHCYLPEISALQAAGIAIHGLAHITGGGVPGNLPRVLPAGLGAEIRRGTWTEPAIFGLIQSVGNVSDAEMFDVFNMGLGMLIVLPLDEATRARDLLPEAAQVGEIVLGDGVAVQ